MSMTFKQGDRVRLSTGETARVIGTGRADGRIVIVTDQDELLAVPPCEIRPKLDNPLSRIGDAFRYIQGRYA